MTEIFPDPIQRLPEADIPLDGVKAYMSQSDTHQIIFMVFEKDIDLPEHSHAAQIGIVLEGRIDLVIGGKKESYSKGDRYFIPKGVLHSGKIHSGYADITFFDQSDRYAKKILMASNGKEYNSFHVLKDLCIKDAVINERIIR